jgi:hypothetical protein
MINYNTCNISNICIAPLKTYPNLGLQQLPLYPPVTLKALVELGPFLRAPLLVMIIFKRTRTRIFRSQDLWFSGTLTSCLPRVQPRVQIWISSNHFKVNFSRFVSSTDLLPYLGPLHIWNPINDLNNQLQFINYRLIEIDVSTYLLIYTCRKLDPLLRDR